MVDVKVCAKCGMSIPSQEIISGKASLVGGQLLCSDCVSGGATAAPNGTVPQPAKEPVVEIVSHDAPISLPTEAAPLKSPVSSSSGEEPLKFDMGDDSGEGVTSGIQVFSGAAMGTHERSEDQYKRKPHVSGAGAIRVRTFDAKLTRAALQLMDEQINAWLDETGFEAKNVTTTIGDIQGKVTEQHLIVNVWY